MSLKSKQRTRKRSRKVHPLDKDRLIMDAIYCSNSAEVQEFYRQVVKEEDMTLKEQISRGETWSVDAYLDRVHMKMGQRFIHLLSPVMQQRFRAEYPLAFISAGSVEMSSAV